MSCLGQAVKQKKERKIIDHGFKDIDMGKAKTKEDDYWTRCLCTLYLIFVLCTMDCAQSTPVPLLHNTHAR